MSVDPSSSTPDPRFFSNPEEFAAWLEQNHEAETELLVGFYKKKTGLPSMTWPESVAEALRFGWIDGVRRSLGEEAYTIRFTPRKRGSNWSNVNVRMAEELIRTGRMRPAGRRAFDARQAAKTGVYSFEQRKAAKLPPEAEARLRSEPDAWTFFNTQPPSYRQAAIWWVVSAKREETRERRLGTLIEDSAAGQRIAQFRRG